MFENVIEMSMLYDFYGELLSDKQKAVMQFFHEEDLTQSEIADQLEISRQAVHEAIKACEKSLHEFEDKLGLVAKFKNVQETLKKNDSLLEQILDGDILDGKITKLLLQIKSNNEKLLEIENN